jgi:hypothetical protein
MPLWFLPNHGICVNGLGASYLSVNSIELAEVRCPWRTISRVLGRAQIVALVVIWRNVSELFGVIGVILGR